MIGLRVLGRIAIFRIVLQTTFCDRSRTPQSRSPCPNALWRTSGPASPRCSTTQVNASDAKRQALDQQSTRASEGRMARDLGSTQWNAVPRLHTRLRPSCGGIGLGAYALIRFGLHRRPDNRAELRRARRASVARRAQDARSGLRATPRRRCSSKPRSGLVSTISKPATLGKSHNHQANPNRASNTTLRAAGAA